MFIVALFAIAKCWKQSKCPSLNEWIKKLWYIYIMEYYTGERTPTLRDSMIGEYYTKLNKSVGKTDISYDLTYKRNLMNKTN